MSTSIVLTPLDDYIQLAHKPRDPNRCQVHLLKGPSELMDNYDFWQFVDLQDEPAFQDALTEELRTHLDIRRGDVVFIEDYLGYRNNGMMIFNGKRVIPLDSEPDDYGTVPKEFQVITEFPIMYWCDTITHNSYVPFNFSKHIPNPLPVQFLSHENKPYFKFTLTDRFSYYIFPALPYDWTYITQDQFERSLKTATYFENYSCYQAGNADYIPPIPPNIMNDYILVLPDFHIENVN